MSEHAVRTATLPPTPLTIEGSSVLHQMLRIRWAAWRALTREKQVVKIESFVAVVLFRDLDNDDAGRNDFENFGEGIIQSVNDILTRLGGGRRNGRG